MKLQTGKVAFPIEFDNGDKDNIYFNPNDTDLPLRIKDLQGKVQERIKKLKDFEPKEDGTPANDSFIEEYRKMRNIVCEELDIAFGGEISKVVFKYCSPFAIINGEYNIIQFIKAVLPEIEKHAKKANADTMKKMQKHIAKYKK